jgi:hypothetical protein
MAFSFPNAAQGGAFDNATTSSLQTTARDGPELKEIQTSVSVDSFRLDETIANSQTATWFPVDKWRG